MQDPVLGETTNIFCPLVACLPPPALCKTAVRVSWGVAADFCMSCIQTEWCLQQQGLPIYLWWASKSVANVRVVLDASVASLINNL